MHATYSNRPQTFCYHYRYDKREATAEQWDQIAVVLDMIGEETTPEKLERRPARTQQTSLGLESETALVLYDESQASKPDMPLQVPVVYAIQWAIVPLSNNIAVQCISTADTGDVAQILRKALQAEPHDPACKAIRKIVKVARVSAKQSKDEVKATAKLAKATAKLASKGKAAKVKGKERKAAATGKGGTAKQTSANTTLSALG